MNSPISISFWEKQFLSHADIVIVGAGIVGLQTATRLKLKFPHRQVWVLDRAPFSLGASMRNAGFACFGSVGEILDDIARTNEQEALALYENRFRGFEMLLHEFGEAAIGYEKTGGYEIFTPSAAEEQQLTLANVDKINTQLFSVHNANTFIPKQVNKLGMKTLETGIYTAFEGALQTHLLYKNIRKKAIENGVEIYTGLEVISTEKNGNMWRINTKEGYSVSCKKLVLCTNGFSHHLLENAAVTPARGQILVTSYIPGLAWNNLMHADKGYIYFRSLGTRILIGGARNQDFETETTSEINSNEKIKQHLINFLQEVVVPGEKFEITEEWSGIMGMNQNRTPVVEQVEEDLFAAYRMGGMGVALSTKISLQLADLVEL